MDNLKKEKIGIILNIINFTTIGTKLREYCEDELIQIIKTDFEEPKTNDELNGI